MRGNLDPEAPRLCNNCLIREEKRSTPKKEDNMSTIDIVVKCPREDQIKIEEYCINHGMDFTRYFLELHYASQAATETMNELTKKHSEEKLNTHAKDPGVKLEQKISGGNPKKVKR
jgi:hypothetical protein